MRKIFLSFAVAGIFLLQGEIRAQNTAYKTDVPYSMPRTTVKVTLVVEQETVVKGPYAKFSQQYIGVQAPLNDRTGYRIIGADLGGFNEADLSQIIVLPATVPGDPAWPSAGQNALSDMIAIPASTTGVNDVTFGDMGINPVVYTPSASLSVDRRSAREKTLEEMAADAANTLFTLRKRRFDLVTGEAGENVYGAGLQAALDEMRRIEDEYLSLFAGKRTVIRKAVEFDVVPEAGKTNAVVCRFSPQKGVTDLNDMTGEPVVLTLHPEGNAVSVGVDPKKATKGVVYYRVADMTQCRLFNGQELIAVKRLPVYQFGATVEVAGTR